MLFSVTCTLIFDDPRTFFPTQDILAAIGHTKHGNNIADQHRKRESFYTRIAGLVSSTTDVNWVKSMTPVERHAELIYAETLFEKVRV